MMQTTTARLTLRPIEEADMEQMLALLTDETVSRTYMIPELTGREQAERLARRYMACSHDQARIAVGLALGGRVIGFIHDVGIDDREVELGYAMHPGFHGCGYMTEALEALLRKLFDMGYRTIWAGAFKENAASIRVMEKCGMRRTGRTETVEYRGKLYDCVYYAVKSDDIQTDGGWI